MMMFDEILILLLSLVLIMVTAVLITVYYWVRKNKDSKVKIGFFKYICGLPGKCGSWIKKTWIKIRDSLCQSIAGSKKLAGVFLIVSFIYFLAVFISQRGFMYGLIGAVIAVVMLIVFGLVTYVIVGFLGYAIYGAVFEDTLSKDLLLPVAILVLGFYFDMMFLLCEVQFHTEYNEGFCTKLIFWGVSFSLVIFWLHRLLEMCQNTARYISSARRKIPAAIYLFFITYLVLTLYVFSHVPFGGYRNDFLEYPFDTWTDWINAFLRAAYYVLMTVTMAGDDSVTPIGMWGKFDHAVIVLSGVFFLTVVASMFLETGEEEERDTRRHINRTIQRIKPGRRYRTRQQNNSVNGRKRYIQRRKMK